MSFRSIFLFTFACATSAFATGPALSPDDAAQYALKHNPTLAAARLGIEEARGRLQQSGRLSNPELDLGFQKNTRGRESSATVGLMQRFPLTARLGYEKAVSRAQLSAAESEVRDAERRLAAEARTLAVKLIALREQRQLRSAQLTNIHELSEFLHKLVQTGEGSSTDVLQVELESRGIEIEKLQLSALEVGLLGEFRTLLGAPPSEPLAVSGKLPAPGAPPKPAGSAQRPDILAAQSRAEAARHTVRELQARRMGDIGAGISYSRQRILDDPNPLQTDRIVGFQLSLPLPLWNTNSGRIQEATAAAARAEKEVEATRLTARGEVLSAKGAMEAYSQILSELDSKALPQATQLEEQLRSSYSTGQAPLLDVLRARSRRLELQRQRLDALRDYHLARIRHTSATH